MIFHIQLSVFHLTPLFVYLLVPNVQHRVFGQQDFKKFGLRKRTMLHHGECFWCLFVNQNTKGKRRMYTSILDGHETIFVTLE